MHKVCAPALAFALAFALVACHPSAGPSLVAAPAPAQPGQRLTGAAAGTLLAAYIDDDVLPLLAPGDRPHVELALIRAFNARKGEQVTWANSTTGSHGFAMPHDISAADGLPCRTLHLMTSASGQRAWTYQTACQQPDGTWSRREG